MHYSICSWILCGRSLSCLETETLCDVCGLVCVHMCIWVCPACLCFLAVFDCTLHIYF
uniref:Uncharacterized protein n=1 Tax=Rhizophora mucronata TaxID=61149 RepID=A0A2P2P4S2_RHIMU